METKKEYLERIFYQARMRGLCTTQGKFAELLGMNPSTISNALKGNEKYLTDNIIKRVQSWERQVLQPMEAPERGREESKPDIVIPAATMEMYTSMAKSIDRLSALVEKLMPGASAYTVPGSGYQKNFQTDKR